MRDQTGWGELLGPVTPEQRGVARSKTLVEWPDRISAEQRFCVPHKLVMHIDGTDLVSGLVVEPAGTPRGIAIAFHQTTEPSVHGVAEPFGISGDTQLRYGLELAERGYIAVGINYPGFGGYECDAYSLGYASVSAKGIWNHFCLLQAARDRWPNLPVALVGHSLGGTNALLLSWWCQCPMVTVCSAALTLFPEFAKAHGGNLGRWSRRDKYMPRIRERYGDDPDLVPCDFDDVIRGICPKPLFASVASRDDIFPIDGARRAAELAYTAYESTARCVIHEYDVGHSFPAEARMAAYKFIDKHIKYA